MIDLSPDQLKIVLKILTDHVPEYEIRVFGSRTTGKAKPHSDLDLVLMTDKPLATSRMAHLRDAFESSNLPMRVDLVDWASISEEFRKIILGQCEILQSR